MREDTDLVSAVEVFLAELIASGASPKTVEIRRLGLARFCRHCAAHGIARVQDITLPFLEAYRGDLRRQKLSDATVEQYLRLTLTDIRRMHRESRLGE